MKIVLAFMLFMFSCGLVAGKIHDPTEPKLKLGASKASSDALSAVVQPEIELTLQSIMRGKKGNIAIISGTLVNKGDLIKGFLVSQINSDHVVIVNSGTQKRLYVYE
jgi:hypothetical protein